MSHGPSVDDIRQALTAGKAVSVDASQVDKRAAVAIVLRQSQRGAETLLIRRAESPRDPWSGHMAFPGGRHDPTDTSLQHTALRETREEVGLNLDSSGTLLGRLDEIMAMSKARQTGLAVSPFVFAYDGPDTLRLNATEVVEALWAPLGPMFDGSIATEYAWEYRGNRLRMPAYDVRGRIVWGLTHRMLGSLGSLL